MIVRSLTAFLMASMCLLVVRPAGAQPLGTFRWQLSPFCNVVTLAVTQNGSIYRLEGFDDQCGSTQRGTVIGMAVPNTDGTIEMGLTVVSATGAAPSHVDVTISLPSIGGPWRDSAGNSGTLIFNPGAAGGAPRPAGLGGAAIDPAQIQHRVTGTCSSGTFIQSVAQNGGVTCASDTVGTGDITSVNAGAGLVGGAVFGNATLSVNFGGPGVTATVARADHRHQVADDSVAIGLAAISNNLGSSNVAVGTSALSAPTGNNNVAVGWGALNDLTTGSGNIALGWLSGNGLVTGSNNLYIGTTGGVANEAGTIRLGGGLQTRAFIAGVSGVNNGGASVPVTVSALGQLGITVSSRRFKEQIEPIGDVGAALQALRPVSFFYKPEFENGARVRQYGLIAEEVDAVLPGLVVRDAQGEIQTVRYQFLAPLLLAEVQRLERERAAQERRLSAQEQEIAALRAEMRERR